VGGLFHPSKRTSLRLRGVCFTKVWGCFRPKSVYTKRGYLSHTNSYQSRGKIGSIGNDQNMQVFQVERGSKNKNIQNIQKCSNLRCFGTRIGGPFVKLGFSNCTRGSDLGQNGPKMSKGCKRGENRTKNWSKRKGVLVRKPNSNGFQNGLKKRTEKRRNRRNLRSTCINLYQIGKTIQNGSVRIGEIWISWNSFFCECA